MRIKTENLSPRIEPEIRKGIEQEAARDRRPISHLVGNILADWLAARAADTREAPNVAR
jgi:hypothetical protein